MINKKIDVLDHGYVRLRDFMGSDLTVVDSARVSFDKRAEWSGRLPWLREILFHVFGKYASPRVRSYLWNLKPGDRRLLNYLARHEHKLPFGHAMLSFEVYAPMIVVRQWFKHIVGSTFLEEGQRYLNHTPGLYEELEIIEVASPSVTEAWSESSRRYVTENNEFYIPDVWRKAPANKKQGSGEPFSALESREFSDQLEFIVRHGQHAYDQALEAGVAPEQARLFLPYGALYVRFAWTCSLLRVIEFLKLREAGDAQVEIQQFAMAVRQLAQPLFNETFSVDWGSLKEKNVDNETR